MDFISAGLATEAEKDTTVHDTGITGEPVYFTASEQPDEAALYTELNSRLGKLETSVVIDLEELDKIREVSAGFRLAMDKLTEIKLRIDWLERLYSVSGELEGVVIPDEASRLLARLAPVQDGPLKDSLMNKLQAIEGARPEDVMQIALAEAGDEFVNLGQAGREFVLAKAGGDVGRIRDLTRELESAVRTLGDVKTAEQLVSQLETLPLASFQHLSPDRKIAIAAALMEQSDWSGLATLDRSINKLARQIDGEPHVSKETLDAVEIKKYIRK